MTNPPRKHFNFIGGERLAAGTGKTFQTFNPAEPREVVAEYPAGGRKDAQAAIEAAGQAFRGWAAATPVARGRVLSKASQIKSTGSGL
jgi:acyl-CoA reductase-like NAD-dependent aldehyde dehydrogenase